MPSDVHVSKLSQLSLTATLPVVWSLCIRVATTDSFWAAAGLLKLLFLARTPLCVWFLWCFFEEWEGRMSSNLQHSLFELTEETSLLQRETGLVIRKCMPAILPLDLLSASLVTAQPKVDITLQPPFLYTSSTATTSQGRRKPQTFSLHR